MIIVGLTDIHGDVSRLSALAHDLAAADLVVIAGDLTHFGGRKAALEVLRAVQDYCANVVAVSGNCDRTAVENLLVEEQVSLHGNQRLINGVTFWGAGGSLGRLGVMPNVHTETEFEATLEKASRGLKPGAPNILVSHQPPRDTANDLAFSGAHVGSHAVRAVIEKLKPLVCFTGHIHEARGIDTIGRTKIVNPGPLRQGRYAYAVVSEELEALEIRG